MHAILRARRPLPATGAWIAAALGLTFLASCREKVSPAQCDALVARYAELVVRDRMPEAPADVVSDAQKHVREEAVGDEGFRNCTTEVGPKEFGCAMAATTPDAVEKCLE